jgi:MYXO-CTERM domain-containing protein
VNEGLWALAFGNAGPGFDPNALYLTAGINDEADGLFASLTPVPEPSTFALAAGGLLALVAGARVRRRRDI